VLCHQRVEGLVQALLEIDRVAVRRRPVDHDDRGHRDVARAQAVQQGLGLGAAQRHPVERDEVGEAAGVEDQPVVPDDADAVADGLVRDRGTGGGVDRVEHQYLRPLRDGLLRLRLLSGRAELRVVVDQVEVGVVPQLLERGREGGLSMVSYPGGRVRLIYCLACR
jgi:hypothetical protein